jgi:hypothetical protein
MATPSREAESGAQEAFAPTACNPLGPAARDVKLCSRVHDLAEEWILRLGQSSNPDTLMAHPAFQSLVAIGWDAVPQLLREVESRPSLLVWALHEITGENPVPPSAGGRFREMATAWAQWGRRRGYL